MADNYFNQPGSPPPKPPTRKRPERKPAANGHTDINWLAGQEWREDLARTESGKILRTLANVLIALRQAEIWKDAFAWNSFSSRLMVTRHLPGTYKTSRKVPRELTEPDVTNVTDWMQHNGILVASQTVQEAIRAVGDDHACHPVREYLSGLTWDETDRLDMWLIDYLGVTDTPLHRVFASRWMIGLVARAFDPGCQLDTALILESRQGLRKSTALRVLAEPWFTDHVPDLSSKDALEQLQGVWIVELAELSSLNRAETHRIKSFLSTRFDRFRPSFGHFSSDHPRQCGFAGTINPGSNGYLRDETGGRRFWIVACGAGWTERQQVDVDKLRGARDQLWAEAVRRYRDGKPWWLNTTELETGQEAAAELRQTDDPRERKVRNYVESLASVHMDEILGPGCLDIAVDRWTVALRTEIGYVMSALKWKRYRPRLENGKREWRYHPPAGEPSEEPPPKPVPGFRRAPEPAAEIIDPNDIPFT